MPKRSQLSRADFKLAEKARFPRKQGTLFSLSHGFLPGSRQTSTKIACVVSKKIAAGAVSRNLIKRRCRDAARELAKNIKTPITLIFYAKTNAKKASYGEIKRDIIELLRDL